ncbi:phosphoglycolate phosphatase [Ferrimonas sediminum]|uniref:Phosphoglycolate phosphatase n=1 Tax=Ferrimonas sediminum TaxID=718193 RepID=A0A1G8V526_9GAMM|nr:phosphoglycolate phosphatase [Ferrimonas sediminum]SDJ61178.1 phosphoglycolate phosphatase [Ferrimonas sediminum]
MTEFSAIKGIGFDLDGTLADSVPDLAVACDAALKQFNLEGCTEAQVRHWVGNGARVLVQRALQSVMASPSEALITEVLAAFECHYQATNNRGSRLYPGVADTLAVLARRGYKMAVITNKPMQFVPELLESLGIAHYFSQCLGGDSLAEKKPSPQPLQHVMGQWQLPASAFLMVGDSRNDILAAEAAGVVSVGLSYGYNYGEDIRLSQPTLALDHFETLLAHLPARTEESTRV